MSKKKKKRKSYVPFEQIGLEDIKLHIGDKLYKDGELYAEVRGESNELYFLKKPGSSCDMPTPFFKSTVIENILFGIFTIDNLSFQ